MEEGLKDEDCVSARGVELGEFVGACNTVDGGFGELTASVLGGEVGLDLANWAVERAGDLVEGLTGGRKEDSAAVPRERDGCEDRRARCGVIVEVAYRRLSRIEGEDERFAHGFKSGVRLSREVTMMIFGGQGVTVGRMEEGSRGGEKGKGDLLFFRQDGNKGGNFGPAQEGKRPLASPLCPFPSRFTRPNRPPAVIHPTPPPAPLIRLIATRSHLLTPLLLLPPSVNLLIPQLT